MFVHIQSQHFDVLDTIKCLKSSVNDATDILQVYPNHCIFSLVSKFFTLLVILLMTTNDMINKANRKSPTN
jgi:ABC-type iron transport system FetAB permease component